MASPIAAALLAAVSFVSCQRCEKRIRISDDGRDAFVNLSRIDPAAREAMAARAERLLARGRPVAFANPQTPLMGWSSWNTFAVNVSEEILVGIARTMSTNGLKAAGYAYVNLDDGFFWGHDERNRLRFNPKRFPNGLKGMVDGIHALGMKAGIYSDAGANTCGAQWNGETGGVNGGLYGHDAEDCQLHFGELGFDFFKVDYCGGLKQRLDERRRYTEIAAAIRATGRTDVRLNICRWAFPGTWAAGIAGSWRTTRDIRASWSSVRDIVAENLYLSAYAGPGHFNDLDMLEVGQYKGALKSAFGGHGDVGLTEAEETTHFGMWCILSSPLVLGNDVRVIPPTTLRLVTNPYLLHMNQDPLGLQAYVASREGEAYVLVKDAETRFGPSRYVALYNASTKAHAFRVEAKALDLGGRIAAFDLVQRADVGEFVDETTVTVEPHASRFFLFDAEERLDRTVYEAETAYLTDYSELDQTPYGSEQSARRQGRAYWTTNAVASGGVAVVNLGGRASNDLVWRDVKVSRGGRRRLTFWCASPEKRALMVEVDGAAPKELWVSDTRGAFVPVVCDVCVAPGVHSIRLSNAWAPMPDVDRLVIEPAAPPDSFPAPKLPRVREIRLKAKPTTGHLQDVWFDGAYLYWAHTGELFKTDREGNVVRSARVGGHHAGLEVRNGRLYTAVCAFNGEPRGQTTPDCHVMIGEYDAETLDRIAMHVLDVNDRAGSLAMLDDGTFLVGCLRPGNIRADQVRVHHIGRDYKLIKSYVLDNVPVKLGVETIRKVGDRFYLGFYGCAADGTKLAFDAIAIDGSFREVWRGKLGSALGFVVDGDDVWVGATRQPEPDGKHASSLRLSDTVRRTSL